MSLWPSEPALPAEKAEQPHQQHRHHGDDHPERMSRSLAGERDIHPEEARDDRQRQEHDAEDREHAQDLVLPVRDYRLVRVLERLDDLLVIVEQVPDPLGRVDDVVEVELQLLRQEPLDVALEQAQRRALGLDDLAVGDDLLLDVGDVADDLLRTPFEQLVLERVELVRDLVEDGEAVVEEVVEDFVQQPARSLREELPTKDVVRLAAAEKPRDRRQLDVRQRYEVVGTDEDVELAGVQPAGRLVEHGKVEDDEEVALLRVVVDLRALALREHVLDVERMPAEPCREALDLVRVQRVEVDPGQAGGVELSSERLLARCDLRPAPYPRASDAREARHRY